MGRKLRFLFILPLLLSLAPGCGLLIGGGALGISALRRSSALKDTVKTMKVANDKGDAALAAGKAKNAVGHYRQAQQALFAFAIKYRSLNKIPNLAADKPEIARTWRGLVKAHLAQKNDTAAAAASRMLPPAESASKIKELKIAAVKETVVAAAPHMYHGMRVEWHGEIMSARHDPASDTMQVTVVPYGFVRRQVGMRSQRYYDHQLKIYRHRLVPRYRRFKVHHRTRAFRVSLKGYVPEVSVGRAASFFGMLGEGGVLTEAVATRIKSTPGGRLVWMMGVDLVKARGA